MAFPTAVNSQITDSALTPVNTDSSSPLPQQILEISDAFVKTLEMENHVLQDQLSGVIKMVVNGLDQMISLCEKAASNVGADSVDDIQQMLASLKQQAASGVQNSTSQGDSKTTPVLPEIATDGSIDAPSLELLVIRYVGLSYKNAVSAQQQSNMLMQAATTALTSTILSTVTALVGVAFSKGEKQQG